MNCKEEESRKLEDQFNIRLIGITEKKEDIKHEKLNYVSR